MVAANVKPLKRAVTALCVTTSGLSLAWLDPDIDIAEIKAVEESVLGKSLTAYDVAEAVLEAEA